MSIGFKLTGSILAGGSAVVVGHSIKSKIEEKFPPRIAVHQIGEKILHEGKPAYVVGCFGASKTVIENFDRNRETYYGDKKVAESYAQVRAGKHCTPYVAVLVSDHPIGIADLGVQRFEGPHAPISKESMAKKNVRIGYFYEVTDHTASGFKAALKRAEMSNLYIGTTPHKVHKHARRVMTGEI